MRYSTIDLIQEQELNKKKISFGLAQSWKVNSD